MAELRNPLYLLPTLLFLIPVNIYVIGDWLGTGIQWVLFRYQMAIGGESLISFTRDIHFILTGLIIGKSSIAGTVWTVSVLLLVVYFIIAVWAIITESEVILRKNAIILLVCGSLFLISDFVQYGIFLHGSGGLCIPVGIPLFFIMGIWGYSYGFCLVNPLSPLHKKKTPRNNACSLSRLLSWFERYPNGELASLILISFVVKTIAFFSGLLANLPFDVILGATKLYYWYATSLTWGQIPYSSYYVPYPQFFFIPLLIALIPALVIQNYTLYLYSFSALMIIFDTATLVLVYSIGGKLWGRDKAFLCGLLYATAFSAAFFIPITYDAFPSFILLLSLWIYLYRSESTGFLLATAGALTKWYPGLSLPYYLLHGFKTGKIWGHFRRSIILSGILVFLALIPFILLNAGGFISTYTNHFGRDAEVNSSIYYLDTICNFFLNLEPFDTLSILLVIIIELALLYWYYRHLDSTPQALLGCIFLSIFVFAIFNRVFSTYYLIWFLPFLSLFLIKSSRHILLFYAVQVIMYLETPVLFGIVYAPFNAFNPGFNSATSYSVLTGSLPSLPFMFYTLKFGIFLLVLLVIVRDLNHDHTLSGPHAHLPT